MKIYINIFNSTYLLHGLENDFITGRGVHFNNFEMTNIISVTISQHF